jgi:Mg-chelatase subunit ChlD
MPEWSHPALLGLLVVVPLLRRLHRRHEAEAEVVVPALFLWPARPATAAGRRGRKVDPRWRLRAAAAALLVLAAAGPSLLRPGGRRVEVAVDDGPSLRAREREGTRRDAAAAALAAALAKARPAEVRLVSLAHRGRTLDLAPDDPAGWAAAIDAWLAPARVPAPPPAPAALDRGRERWLLTDGADPRLHAWARDVPFERVIGVGEATENDAVTGLAARPSLRDPERLRALVRVTNGGTEAARRRIAIEADGRLVHEEDVALAPGRTLTRAFDAPADATALTTRLGAGDAVAEDDSLTLPLDRLRRARVRVDPGCGPHLRRALARHPGLVPADGGHADLAVACGGAPPADGAAGLWVRGREESGADDAVREHAGPPRLVEAHLDLESPARVGRPEYVALVSDLVDRALGRPLLDRAASVEVPADAVPIAPHAPAAPAATRAPDTVRARRDLAPVLLALAAALLLADAARRGPSRGGIVARVALAAAALLALRGPALPWGHAPLDVIALVDDSASVDRGAVGAAWRRLAAALRELPGAGRLSVLRFAAEPVVEVDRRPLAQAAAGADDAPPRRLPLDRGRTDLGRALDAALARAATDRATAVVVVTDGVETDGDAGAALAALRAASIPVVALATRRRPEAGNAWIAALDVPPGARAGDSVPIVATVGAAAAGVATVQLDVDGAPRASRLIALRPGAVRVPLDVTLAGGGTHRVRVRVVLPDDPRPADDAREALIDVQGPPRVLYVAGVDPSALLDGLRAGGWDVETGAPDAGRSPALVVLDDVAVRDAPAGAWTTLGTRVQRDGTGLLVLGGPRTFGAGGYRGSTLETLLPLLAEGSRPGTRAAVLFLVDTSGSMERDRDGRRRLGLAWGTVAAAVGAVPATDLVGVSVFALEPRELLPFGPPAAAAERLAADLPGASGGTRLRPALDHALARLRSVRADQRLLVVVTDGFVAGEDLGPAARGLADAGVSVVVLATGADVDTAALAPLVRAGATLLRAGETATLPRLVAERLAAPDTAIRRGVFHPRPTAPLPFALDAPPWPAVTGYAVTRARPKATVELESELDEPLLATGRSGVGRVAVLPAGLGAWAPDWSTWSGWAPLTGGLLGWLARPAVDPRLDLRVDDGPDGLAIVADVVGDDGEWVTAPAAVATVVDPAGRSRETPLAPVAPGRLAATVPAPVPGVYRLAVRAGDATGVRHVLRSDARELAPPSAGDPLSDWAEAGLLEAWPAAARPAGLVPAASHVPVRPWLAVAALAAYLALVAREEGRGAGGIRRADR